MMYSASLTTLLVASLASIVATVPLPQSNFPPPPPDTKYYLLKAKTLPDSPHPEFDGIYIESYHTGAGLGDATFNTSETSPQGFLNGTQQQFNLSAADSYIPWSMELIYENYAAFSPVEINAGLGNTNGAFYFNSTAEGSLWYNAAGNSTDPYYDVEDNLFVGWLACDWVHQDLPQLFWLNSGYSAELPSNCAPIYLVPEYVN